MYTCKKNTNRLNENQAGSLFYNFTTTGATFLTHDCIQNMSFKIKVQGILKINGRG